MSHCNRALNLILTNPMMVRNLWLGQRMQFNRLRRREFITLLSGAVTWPLAARAQQARQPARIGFLRAAPLPDHIIAALRRGLSEHGYHEGTTFTLVPSWGDGNLDWLPELAKSLVDAGVDIILSDGTSTAQAAHGATVTVPIVMAGGNDPVRAGLATSLARPGGNVTGFATQVIELTGKTFEVTTEILPGIVQIGVIDPRGVGGPFRAAEAEAAKALGLQLAYVEIGDLGAEGIDQAIRQARDKVQAAVVRGSPFLSSTQRKLIVERAAFHRLPTIYEMRDFVELGGLASYGTDFTELFRLAAGYIVKILNGTKAGDLPIEQATKFELVINLTTAKKLGLSVSPVMLARANEVIE
jgi:putative ABC transport system substrate-binding protein